MWLAPRGLGERGARVDTATDTELRGGRECGTFSQERSETDEAQTAPAFPTYEPWTPVEGTLLVPVPVQSFGGGKARLPVYQ